MSTTEADTLLDQLLAAGVTVDWHTFHLPGREPLARELTLVELLTMPPATWDAEFGLMWPVLPAAHPAAATVDAARDRYFADPRCATALEEAYYRRVEREWVEPHEQADVRF